MTDLDSEREQIRTGSAAEAEANVEGPSTDIVRKGGTFRAFAYRNYVLFWSGALISNVGSWMQMFALSLVVWNLRKVEADLGIINGVSNLPVLFLAIPAGVLADRVNRRVLLIWAQAGLMLQALTIGVLYATGNLSSARPVLSLAMLAVLGLLAGVMSALTFPAWQSMVPDLVPKEVLLNGVALNAAQFQSARLLGPLAAGALLLAGAGMADIFYVNAASFIFVIAALAIIRTNRATPARPAPGQAREGAWKTFTAGISYAVGHPTIGMLLVSLAMLSVFGMPYMTLLPAIVDKGLVPAALLGGAREALIQKWTSYVMASNGLGAVAGALIVASLPKGARRDRMVALMLFAMGLLLVGFALSQALWLTLVISAFAGAAFLTSTSVINTSIQMAVPPQLRGRVMSLFVVAFMGLMPVSSLVFGYLGSAVGPAWAVISGATVLALYAFVLVVRPSILAGAGHGA